MTGEGVHQTPESIIAESVASVYANNAIKQSLSPDNVLDQALFSEVMWGSGHVHGAIRHFDLSGEETIVIRAEAQRILEDPQRRRIKFDEAKAFQERSKAISKALGHG